MSKVVNDTSSKKKKNHWVWKHKVKVKVRRKSKQRGKTLNLDFWRSEKTEVGTFIFFKLNAYQ